MFDSRHSRERANPVTFALEMEVQKRKALDPRLRGDDDSAKPCALRTGRIVT
jgi:hypothetical protein